MKDQTFDRDLKNLVKDIKEIYDPICIILFGSRARKNYHSRSDIDVIVVADFSRKFIDRGDPVRYRYEGNFPLDLFCYTPEEFEQMFFKGIVSILDSIDEGICLYGDDFFKDYKTKLDILKSRGLKKDPPVWILPERMVIE